MIEDASMSCIWLNEPRFLTPIAELLLHCQAVMYTECKLQVCRNVINGQNPHFHSV